MKDTYLLIYFWQYWSLKFMIRSALFWKAINLYYYSEIQLYTNSLGGSQKSQSRYFTNLAHSPLWEKYPNTELFQVRIFLYSDWIRRFTS